MQEDHSPYSTTAAKLTWRTETHFVSYCKSACNVSVIVGLHVMCQLLYVFNVNCQLLYVFMRNARSCSPTVTRTEKYDKFGKILHTNSD